MLVWSLALVVTVLLAFGLAGKALQILAWVVLFLVVVVLVVVAFHL